MAPAPLLTRLSSLSGDLQGGLAGAAVVLPQAAAFGMTVFAPYLGAASGALAGLIGAISLLVIAGLIGGTSGLISSATGATMALLTATSVLLTSAGVAPASIPLALGVVTVLAGMLQFGIALGGGGRLMHYIPYPVIAGLTTGIGVLLIRSQDRFVLGLGSAQPWSNGHWLPLLTATGAFLTARYAPRHLPQMPGPIAGLIGGVIAFQLLVMLLQATDPDHSIPPHWVIGPLPNLTEFRPRFTELALPAALPLPLLLQASFTLAVLASLNTLLTAVVADATTGLRHNARRTLLGQAIGQIAVGLVGGVAGAASVGGTATAVRAGARRWAAPLAGVLLLVMLAYANTIGRWLPVSALSGIIIASAINLIEFDILAWARHRPTRLDAVVALLVVGVTLGYGLIAAVLAGLLLAVVLFVYAQSRIPVIHTRQTGQQRHSVRQRPADHTALLDQHGDRIVIYQLRGALFFATTDDLFARMLPDLDRPTWVILHLRQVLQIDLSSVRLFTQIAARLKAHGGELLFCEVREALGLGRHVERTLRHLNLRPGRRLRIKTFGPADLALEYAENALLKSLGVAPVAAERRFTLAELEVCRDMQPPEIAALAAVLRTRHLARGERLFAAGDPGSDLYLVLSGQVDIRLPANLNRFKRLGIYGPGTVFGTVAFLDPGPRSADAVAVRPSELLVLHRADFDQLRLNCPAAAIALLLALSQMQSHTLRWNATEMQRLIQG